jgi:hypothetical protein
MNAHEIVEQIKALPPEEQSEVAAYLDAVPDEPADPAIRPGFEEAVRKIFAEYDDLFRKLAE